MIENKDFKNPLYHGSGVVFEKFEEKENGKDEHPLSYLGFHFTTDENLVKTHFVKKPDYVVYKVDINVNKTYKISESELVKNIIKFGFKKGYINFSIDHILNLPYFSCDTDSIVDSLIEGELSEIPKKKISIEYKQYLIEQGYDSIEYSNEIEIYNDKRHDWIIFDSNRIKIINIYKQQKNVYVMIITFNNFINENSRSEWLKAVKKENRKMSDFDKKLLKTGLPKEAIKELEEMYVSEKTFKDIKVVEDPYVQGTYAARITRDEEGEDFTFDLLWYKNGWDEVEYETWPPTSGEQKWFL